MHSTVTTSTAPSGVGTNPVPPIVLTIPADKTLVVLVRSAAGHLGARIGMSFQDLDDLRLAVGEACGLFLLPEERAAVGGVLECRFTESDGALCISVSADDPDGFRPATNGLGWALLEALVDELSWEPLGSRVTISLTKSVTARSAEQDR